MMHEFTFFAAGLDPEADDFEDRFFEAGCDDATLAVQNGHIVVHFEREAEDRIHAVTSAFCNVLASGAFVTSFEPGYLVTGREIAERSQLSRSAVSLYKQGKRANGFPAPSQRVMSDHPLWDWAQVASWLHDQEKVGLGAVIDARVDRAVCRTVESARSVTTPDKWFMAKLGEQRSALMAA